METGIPILIIAGPTASGKSSLALSIALDCQDEIIGADSRQIYKHVDIGTAKPSLQDRTLVPHHLVDFVELDQGYTVAEYVRDAAEKITDVYSRGRLPILCGGTGLYIRRFLKGIFPVPGSCSNIRKGLHEQEHNHGLKHLYNQLYRVDPEAAAKIHPNDRVRIIRALEVYETTLIPITVWQKKQTKPIIPLVPLYFILSKPREKLYKDICNRVDDMVTRGLIEEVEKIMQMGYDFSLNSLSSLGYGDIALALRGKISMSDAINRLKQKTCQYAKRQLTWFRKEENTRWITFETPEQFQESKEQILARWIILHG